MAPPDLDVRVVVQGPDSRGNYALRVSDKNGLVEPPGGDYGSIPELLAAVKSRDVAPRWVLGCSAVAPSRHYGRRCLVPAAAWPQVCTLASVGVGMRITRGGARALWLAAIAVIAVGAVLAAHRLSRPSHKRGTNPCHVLVTDPNEICAVLDPASRR
jgi:hypothetical protein